MVSEFEDWRYWSDERRAYSALPDWAIFALELGLAVTRLPGDLGNTLVAVSLPTRGYSAVLSAAGSIVGLKRSLHHRGVSQHLEKLRSLLPGTTVWVESASLRIEGSFVGFTQVNDEEYIRVETRQGRRSGYSNIPSRDAMRVQVAVGNREIRQSRIVNRVPLRGFASAAFEDASYGSSGLHTLLVGGRHSLESELSGPKFCILDDGGPRSGRLQDIVGAANIQDRLGHQAFYSAIEVVDGSPYPAVNNPQIAIFDGDRAFTRKSSAKQDIRHWIVLLDRTRRGFEDACASIDDMYLSRGGLVDSKYVPGPPAGIEMLAIVRGERS